MTVCTSVGDDWEGAAKSETTLQVPIMAVLQFRSIGNSIRTKDLVYLEDFLKKWATFRPASSV